MVTKSQNLLQQQFLGNKPSSSSSYVYPPSGHFTSIAIPLKLHKSRWRKPKWRMNRRRRRRDTFLLHLLLLLLTTFPPRQVPKSSFSHSTIQHDDILSLAGSVQADGQFDKRPVAVWNCAVEIIKEEVPLNYTQHHEWRRKRQEKQTVLHTARKHKKKKKNFPFHSNINNCFITRAKCTEEKKKHLAIHHRSDVILSRLSNRLATLNHFTSRAIHYQSLHPPH